MHRLYCVSPFFSQKQKREIIFKHFDLPIVDQMANVRFKLERFRILIQLFPNYYMTSGRIEFSIEMLGELGSSTFDKLDRLARRFGLVRPDLLVKELLDQQIEAN